MAVGVGSVVTFVASGGDLHTVSATSVFDRELELRRLAALCGCGKLGAVATRNDKNRQTCDRITSLC